MAHKYDETDKILIVNKFLWRRSLHAHLSANRFVREENLECSPFSVWYWVSQSAPGHGWPGLDKTVGARKRRGTTSPARTDAPA